jgi:hypothetical protein
MRASFCWRRIKRCFLQQLRAKKKLLTVISSSKRSTSNITAMLNSLKYALLSHSLRGQNARSSLLDQVREVFEELGLKDDVLNETCQVVGSSDETLLEFMKVLPLLRNCNVWRVIAFVRLLSLAAATTTWSAVPSKPHLFLVDYLS